MNRPRTDSQLRTRIAIEAARLIDESGIRDYALAKRKAAQRLGIGDDAVLPKNAEIDAALREHQRLFHADNQPRRLHMLRETACEAMRFFAAFEPRLVGAVLDGSADAHSAVCLHLFSDDPDAPARHLAEHGIEHDTDSRRMRLDQDNEMDLPVLRFVVDDVTIDATIFPYDGLRQSPLDRISGGPMRRASYRTVATLVDNGSEKPLPSAG
ncbi:MAG: hypothetical protein JSR65_04040 [Proteobacteria bacterium]|nr:hypothetical protein [Pseudomonadota bacterium]